MRPLAVVGEAVQQVAADVGEVVGQPRGHDLGTGVRVEDLDVLVGRAEQHAQRLAQPVDVGLVAGVGLEALLGDDVDDGAERRPGRRAGR